MIRGITCFHIFHSISFHQEWVKNQEIWFQSHREADQLLSKSVTSRKKPESKKYIPVLGKKSLLCNLLFTFEGALKCLCIARREFEIYVGCWSENRQTIFFHLVCNFSNFLLQKSKRNIKSKGNSIDRHHVSIIQLLYLAICGQSCVLHILSLC